MTKLVERLEKPSTAYGMEISAEKIKLLTNNTCGINTEIKVNGQNLRLSQTSSTWAQLELMRVPSLRYSPGLLLFSIRFLIAYRNGPVVASQRRREPTPRRLRFGRAASTNTGLQARL